MSFPKSPILTACVFSLLFSLPALAGPPFFTDDPEPVAFGHNEFYLFSTLEHNGNANFYQVPAVEYNTGIYPETQLHLVVPLVYAANGTMGNYGLGDGEIGVKYRFIEETADFPQIGTFPLVDVPTGNYNRGLGNGNALLKLPVWLQKSWGDWKSYGGAGAAISSALGLPGYLYGGWLVQKNVNERLTLGGELFAQDTERILNFGGYYNFASSSSLLFSLGRSLSGDNHYLCYLGLYQAW